MQRITIVKRRRNIGQNVNEELQWLGNSLGLFNLRDKDSSCFRIFITFIKKVKKDKPISSDEVAEQLRLSRGTVVHHLIKLMDAGLIVREKEGYLLREDNLRKVIEEMKRDVVKVFQELEEVAKDIDERLG